MGGIPRNISLLGHFLVHVLVASILFILIAGAAVIVWRFTLWIKALGAPYEIWAGCDLVADLLFAVDVICASFFVVVEGWKLVREIAAGLKESPR